MSDLLLLAFLAIPLIVALLGFAWVIYQESQDRRVRRFNQLQRLQPDANGNYEVFFDPQVFESYQPRRGNATVYPMQNYIVAPNEVRPALPRKVNDKLLVINHRGASPRSFQDVQAEHFEQAEQLTNVAAQPEQLEQERSEKDYIKLLTDAKNAGRAKSTTIEAITGVKRGGSASYRQWADLWDSLGWQEEGVRDDVR